MTHSPTHLWPGRPATGRERGAAARIAAALDAASDRGADIIEQHSTLPPGRINTSQLMQAEAQRQMGVPVTATPFTRQRRRQRRAPALRLGLAIDRSPSMQEYIDEAVSAAWALQRAGTLARQCRSIVDTACFDRDAHLMRVPQVAATVPKVTCPDSDGIAYSTGLPAAVELLCDRVGLLTHPDDSRLLVVISDSALNDRDRAHAAVRRLAAAGVRMLWISVEEEAPDIPGAVSIAADDLLTGLPQLVVDALAGTATPKGFL